MSSNFQLDYGGFDPTFVGVTVRCSSRRAWDMYNVSASPYIAHLPKEEQFEALNVQTVLSHETRHFHDFLITPNSAQIFRLRILAYIHILQLLAVIIPKSGRVNCLPLPIPLWCGLNDEERISVLARLPTRSDGKPWIPVDLPYIEANFRASPLSSGVTKLKSREEIEPIIRAALLYMDRIKDFSYNTAKCNGKEFIQPWQVYELSAIIIQLQDLMNQYGPDYCQFYIDNLFKIPGARDYLKLLNTLIEPWPTRSLATYMPICSAVASWSLLGSYEKDNWDACPTERFFRLWALLKKNGPPARIDALEVLFNTWSKTLGVSTVHEGLDDTQRTLSRLLDAGELILLKSENTPISSDKIGKHMLDIVRSVVDASNHMRALFLCSPEKYIDPIKYLNKYLGFGNKSVFPIVRYLFDSGGLFTLLSNNELEMRGYYSQWAIENKLGNLVVSMINPYPPEGETPFFDRNEITQLAEWMGLTDYLFSETSRTHPDIIRPGMALFEDSEITPVELQVLLSG